jgi:predicted Zn finger-like uncharacterized protein
MNLITRCPSCATHYQVDKAVIHAAKGWLRCGQCGHVFDSTGLVLLWTVSAPVGQEPLGVPTRKVDNDLVANPDDRLVLDDFHQKSDPSIDTPTAGAELVSFEKTLLSFKPTLYGPVSDRMDATLTTARRSSTKLARYAVWSFALTLVFQLLFVQRHAILSYWPESESVIRQLCQAIDCQVRPQQDAQGLIIDSSELIQRDEGHALRWTVRNATANVLRMSSLELTLMDGPEKVVLRRVFSPDQTGAPEVLAQGQSWSGELIFYVDVNLRFSDYSLLSFYL